MSMNSQLTEVKLEDVNTTREPKKAFSLRKDTAGALRVRTGLKCGACLFNDGQPQESSMF